jgi:hypothetical protein
MKSIMTFVLHTLIAMVISVMLGGVLAAVPGLLLSPVGPRNWVLYNLATGAPYSPLLWGLGFLFGFFVNRRMRNTSAQWVWIAGMCWFSLWIWDAVHTYDPRWCQGCTVLQNVWRNLFTVGYNSCMQDCRGELLGTTPMLNSIAYSLGACVGLRSNRAGLQTGSSNR